MSTSESDKSESPLLNSDSLDSMNQNDFAGDPFRVLALDGGGMRGLYTVTVLDTLATRFGRELGHGDLDVGLGFDLIAGTSTGGIIACGLAAGRTPRDISEFYKAHGERIFSDPVPSRAAGFLAWAVRNLRQPANSSKGLRLALKQVLGDETLAEVYERRGVGLCIPTVNLATQMARVFKTPHHAPFKQRDNNWSLVDVCLATSAAPLILPVAEIEDPDDGGSFAFIDGGLWANNPTLVSLIEALSIADADQPIEVLSIGTCPPTTGRPIPEAVSNWGLLGWKGGYTVLETALNVVSSTVSDIVRLLKPHLNRKCTVVRLPETPPSPEQAKKIGLDRASSESIQILETLAKHDGDRAHSEARRNPGSEAGLLARMFEGIPELTSGTADRDQERE